MRFTQVSWNDVRYGTQEIECLVQFVMTKEEAMDLAGDEMPLDALNKFARVSPGIIRDFGKRVADLLLDIAAEMPPSEEKDKTEALIRIGRSLESI